MPSYQNTVYQDERVSVRLKISALWVSMLFVFAYVDLFSLYRPDFRADIEAGEIAGFDIGQAFLLFTTIYIVVPSIMVFLSLILRPTLNRITNIALSVVYGLTILASAVGEWNYFILGSVAEAILLMFVIYYAWTWPAQSTPA
jgi:hypothetical protein